MVMVDQAIYWFKGRRWCHMASDLHLEELHVFAAALGIPRRAFQDHPLRNHPHYDVPEELRPQALRLGAVEVTGRELVCRMYRYPHRVLAGRSAATAPAGRPR